MTRAAKTVLTVYGVASISIAAIGILFTYNIPIHWPQAAVGKEWQESLREIQAGNK